MGGAVVDVAIDYLHTTFPTSNSIYGVTVLNCTVLYCIYWPGNSLRVSG